MKALAQLDTSMRYLEERPNLACAQEAHEYAEKVCDCVHCTVCVCVCEGGVRVCVCAGMFPFPIVGAAPQPGVRAGSTWECRKNCVFTGMCVCARQQPDMACAQEAHGYGEKVCGLCLVVCDKGMQDCASDSTITHNRTHTHTHTHTACVHAGL